VRAFKCSHCGQLLFFENSRCLRCGCAVGFVPPMLDLRPLGADGHPERQRCANAQLARCNWITDDAHFGGLCRSCRLTRTRPADFDAEGLENFRVAEGPSGVSSSSSSSSGSTSAPIFALTCSQARTAPSPPATPMA
jgi:hypothetical protein